MPELPEVETTLRGITPHLLGQTIKRAFVRQNKLRWPVGKEIINIKNQPVHSISRRAKYLLIELPQGFIIIHLGMTGSIRVLLKNTPPGKHDHLDLVLTNGKVLRYTDPRRFGCWLWTKEIHSHKLLSSLGPEPLSTDFSADYLFLKSRKKNTAIKPWLMDNKVVVGVGNIYASESLFSSGISPKRKAQSLTKQECAKLVTCIQQVLKKSIRAGGTTISDFLNTEGKPGYFIQQLQVYGQEGKACHRCGTLIKKIIQAQRSTFYCPRCQK